MLSVKEYQTVSSIAGPLMMVEMVDEAKYGHIVDIELRDGSIRHGQILQVENDKVLVQVFEGTRGIDADATTVRFLAKPLELAVSPEILGRVFSGLGENNVNVIAIAQGSSEVAISLVVDSPDMELDVRTLHNLVK